MWKEFDLRNLQLVDRFVQEVWPFEKEKQKGAVL